MAAPVNQYGNPFNMPVLQSMAALTIMLALYKTPLTDMISLRLNMLIDETTKALRKSIYDFPVICLSAGIGFVANQTVSKFAPEFSLSSTPGFEGSLKVAQFVGAAFLTKSALSPFIRYVILENRQVDNQDQLENRQAGNKDKDKDALAALAKRLTLNSHKTRIQHTAVRFLFPLAISTLAARIYGLEVKTVPGALFTASLFGAMNFLGHVFRNTIANPQVKKIIDRLYGVKPSDKSYEVVV